MNKKNCEWSCAMKKHKKQGKIKCKIVEGLALPKDLMLGSSILQIFGNSEIYLENYIGIMEYNSDCIRIKIKEGSVEISGKCLCISYYSNEEMKISGFLHNISYSCIDSKRSD